MPEKDAISRRRFVLKPFRIAMLALTVGAVLLWWQWVSAPGGTPMRFRLIVEIDTPEGIRTGSSVIENRVFDGTTGGWGPIEARTVRTETRGEAVFVDLGQGKQVIALLATGPTGQGGLDGIVPASFGFLPVEEYGRYQSMTGGRMVPPSSQPTMVTFTDLADPASARVVYATGRHYDCVPPMAVNPNCQPRDLGPFVIDRFAETFGPGYALKGIAIQMTTDPITTGIEGKLPFLVTHREKLRRISDDLPPRFQPHFHYFQR